MSFKIYTRGQFPRWGESGLRSQRRGRRHALDRDDGGGITTMRDGVFRSVCNGLEESPMNVGGSSTIARERLGGDQQGAPGVSRWLPGQNFYLVHGTSQGSGDRIAEDQPGRLLIAVGGRIMILQGEGFEEYPLPVAVEGKVRLIVTDSSGALWIGTYQHGVAALRGTQLTLYDRMRGLSSDSIAVLLVDRRGAVWVATRGGGVNRIYRDRITAFGSRGVCWATRW